MTGYDISQNQQTNQIGFFPTLSWPLTSSDFDKTIKNGAVYPTFNWVQAFWDTDQYPSGTTPKLVVSNGNTNPDGTLISSLVYFAFSGERVPMKGQFILSTGTDRFGNTITSTPINPGSPTDSLSIVQVYGGQY